MQILPRIEMIEQLLIIAELSVPLSSVIVSEVVSQGNEQSIGSVQHSLFPVLIEKQLSALPNIVLCDDFRGNAPRTRNPVAWEPLEVELATHFRVWTTSMGHVVAVEGHHMGQHI